MGGTTAANVLCCSYRTVWYDHERLHPTQDRKRERRHLRRLRKDLPLVATWSLDLWRSTVQELLYTGKVYIPEYSKQG